MTILYFLSFALASAVHLRGAPPTTPLAVQTPTQVMQGITQPMGTFTDLDAAPLSMPAIERTVSTYGPYDQVQFTGANAQGIQDPVRTVSPMSDLPSFAQPTPAPYVATVIDLGANPVLDISNQALVAGIPDLDSLSIPSPVGQPDSFPYMTKLKDYIEEYNAQMLYSA